VGCCEGKDKAADDDGEYWMVTAHVKVHKAEALTGAGSALDSAHCEMRDEAHLAVSLISYCAPAPKSIGFPPFRRWVIIPVALKVRQQVAS
jgi:hypothetical protein